MEFRQNPVRSVWTEMELMRRDLARMLRESSESGRFPPPGSITDRVLPALRGEFQVDVRRCGNEITVVADLPGAEKEDISIRLMNPRALEIACERDVAAPDEMRGFYVRERIAGPVRRVIDLPDDVTEDGARASFVNGVLEVTLAVTGPARSFQIGIE